jgi:hypothetical protein
LTAPKRAGRTVYASFKDFLDPIATIAFKVAVEQRKKVFRTNGKQFYLRYVGSAFPRLSGIEDEEYVWIQPVKGFSPCGYFMVKRLLSEEEDD